MAAGKSIFDEYLAQEVQRCKGVYFPVKTPLAKRLMIREAFCGELHPNPDDEFCSPDVGPSYKIISAYQDQCLSAIKTAQPYYEGEPIIVERTHPDGFMIINGHHRWAAALRLGLAKIPVRVVNLTHEEDVRQILANSVHTKRVALDLDEVIFRTEDDAPLERPLPFPWNRMYRERMRLGVPALFHYLAKHGYDIWLYSSNFYSTDYIRNYFRHYHVKIDGVMTAIGKQAKAAGETGKKIEKMITGKYRRTVHIDNNLVLQISGGTKEFREIALAGPAADWSPQVMDAIGELERADAAAGEPS